MKIYNIIEAVNVVIEEIQKRGMSISKLSYVNNNRHAVIKTHSRNSFYILFKRDFFHSFGSIFGNVSGIGESINESCLRRIIESEIKNILIVYANGYIYRISPERWVEYAKKYRTIRITKTEEKDYGFGNERTYSISIKELERWNG